MKFRPSWILDGKGKLRSGWICCSSWWLTSLFVIVAHWQWCFGNARKGNMKMWIIFVVSWLHSWYFVANRKITFGGKLLILEDGECVIASSSDWVYFWESNRTVINVGCVVLHVVSDSFDSIDSDIALERPVLRACMYVCLLSGPVVVLCWMLL